MGFQPTTTTTTLTAKLTPLGRQLLITNTNNLITKFALGDSDANYNTRNALNTGGVPAIGGDLGLNGTASNSTGNDISIRYPILINSLGSNLKSVDIASINVTPIIQNIGQNTIISGSTIKQVVINRNDTDSDYLTNLFTSFGLPLTENGKNTYTATTYANGGWSDTALSGLASDKIAVIAIDNSQYGENLDGKEIKLDLVTTAGTKTIYSTFQNTGTNLTSQDSAYKDNSTETIGLGLSLGFLVSDDILRPNGGDTTLSWSTGFGTTKPFSVNKKRQYNLRTDSNISLTADTVVGVAYLDKGLLVITEPSIVDEFDPSFSGASGTSVTANSVATNVVQNITCVAGRGEFGTSSNPTWSTGDTVRISEIGLYDDFNRLIAYGKFDRHILKQDASFASFGIKITV
jgi:hypothetical protein